MLSTGVNARLSKAWGPDMPVEYDLTRIRNYKNVCFTTDGLEGIMTEHEYTALKAVVIARLNAGESPGAVATALGLCYDEDENAVVLPGVWADDGHCAIWGDYTPDDAEQAAEDYVFDGDWNDAETTKTWWASIETWRAGIDADGDMDFVLGNWGLNTKFKATNERPLTMYVKDFDKNDKLLGVEILSASKVLNKKSLLEAQSI